MSLNDHAVIRPALLEQTGSLLEEATEFVKTGSKKTYKQKLQYTIFVYFVTIFLGASFALIPTTFLDLMSHTGADIEQGALIFMLNALGYTIGSLASGFLYDWFNKDIIFGSSAMLAGIFISLVPVTKMFPLVMGLLFISNIFQGTIDNGCTLLCAVVWGDEANSYQQGQALFYAIGGIIAPFVAEPFLLQTSDQGRNVSVLDTGSLNSTSSLPETHPFTNMKLIFPFIIVGVYGILSSLSFLVIFIRTKLAPVFKNNTEDHKEPEKQLKKISLKYLLAACALIITFFMAYGYILGLGEFSMPFLVDYLGWSKTDGTRLNSVLWTAMAGGSFIGIFLAKILRPSLMIILALIPITGGLIALLVGAKAHSIVVWISYVSVFFGSGSIYPAMVSWVDQRLIRVNGRICSIFAISGCVGDITNVLLLGYLFKHHTPMWLIYLTLGSAVVLCISILVAFRTNKLLSKHISPNLCNDFIICDAKETLNGHIQNTET